MLRTFIFALAVLLFSFVLLAQETQNREPLQKQNKQDKDYVLSVDVDEVVLSVAVLDKEGRPVDGLSKDQFAVFEDNTQQQIKVFKHEDIPLSLGLVIDNSGSMRNKRERVNSAALAFVRESNPEDETFIVNFDDSAYLEQDFTGSIGDLIDALDNLDTRGETALYDAVYLSADHVKSGKKDKKAVLLITDGEDNVSKYGFNKVVETLKQSKVTLYAVGLLEDNDQRGGLFKKPPSKKAREALQKFADITGGQAYFPKSLEEVEELAKNIAHEIRNHYTISYTPTNKKLDGTWRAIQVKVNPPRKVSKVTVLTREGYFAPRPQPVSSNR
ncbi:MAG: VWA domain-containing protein [Acidobacteria bacterium]|nr:MAG: VWA domain-containing protein [Acidobacteriota bacterium]